MTGQWRLSALFPNLKETGSGIILWDLLRCVKDTIQTPKHILTGLVIWIPIIMNSGMQNKEWSKELKDMAASIPIRNRADALCAIYSGRFCALIAVAGGDFNKMKKRRSTSRNVLNLTFSALLSALSVMILALGSVIEVLDITVCLIASMILVIIVIEIGGVYPWLSYAVVSIISLLLLPNKFPAVVYIFFAGNYPILKRSFEKFKPIICWGLKLILFNLEFTMIYIFSVYVFMIPNIGYTLNALVYIICNAVFVMCDIALTRFISIYVFRLRKRLSIKK